MFCLFVVSVTTAQQQPVNSTDDVNTLSTYSTVRATTAVHSLSDYPSPGIILWRHSCAARQNSTLSNSSNRSLPNFMWLIMSATHT